jgi:uncharacterized protein
MIRFLAIGMMVFWGSAAALAQEAPIMGSEASPPLASVSVPGIVTAEEGENYRILVIGDGLAGGMGAGMTRMSVASPQIQIVNRFNESSGIARPEVYDWAAALPKIMEDKEFNAVVVFLGSNDRQSIRDGNFRYVFNTPDWIKAYQAQMDNLIDVLQAQNVDVFWVSLPPMGSALYDADMTALYAIQKDRVEAKNIKFIDIRANFLNPDGTYADRGPDEIGAIRKLRESDGVKFMKSGNNRLGQLVMAAIDTMKSGAAPAIAAVDEPVSPAVVIAELPPQNPEVTIVPEAPAVPSFGQAGIDGSPQIFEPRVTAAAIIEPDKPRQTKVAAAVNALNVSVIPGSAAEKLFARGEADVAPQGRFDDFSVTPSP